MMNINKKRLNQHILWVEINRPDSRNAIDFETMIELDELITVVEDTTDIRLLILRGSGNSSFVSGGDLKKFHSIKSKDKAVEMSRKMHQILSRIEKLPCWTLACINGDAYGGGIELMLAFDFRLAVPTAKFGFTQGKFFLVPGWGGLTRLTEQVGKAKALEWLGKCSILSTNEAISHGLINAEIPGANIQQEVLEWSNPLTKNNRDYIQTLKQGVYKVEHQREHLLNTEIEPFARLWVDEQHQNRVQRFLERTKSK